MTLQWTAVATFLYVEVGVLLFLCLPFISATRYQTIFQLRIWNKVARFWNRFFLTMIIILIVLFLDAVREVRKYSAGEERGADVKLHPNMMDHRHMKLFRAQRNLYISGFSLFLWLVMRRLITLINQLAAASGTTEALQAQADDANQAAAKYMKNNELLKQTLMQGKGDEATTEGMGLLMEEVEKLRAEIKASEEDLLRSQCDVEAMKKQTDGLTQEYERLLKEHEELQHLQDGGDKKDN